MRGKVGVYYVPLTQEYPFLSDQETGDRYVDLPAYREQTVSEPIPRYVSVSDLQKELFLARYARYSETSTKNREAVRSLFCTEKMAFKGCLVPKRKMSEQDYLRLFLQPTGITSSYLTARESAVSSDSLQPVSQKAVAQSFDYFNTEIVAHLENQTSKQQAQSEIKAHVNWNETKKSAVTSLTRSLRVAWAYANRWLGDRVSLPEGQQYDFLAGVYKIYDTQRHMGIVLETQLPQDGLYYTRNADAEILLPGAVIPEAMKTVYIYSELSQTRSVLDTSHAQVNRNTSRYKDEYGKHVFPSGDPLPITLPSEIYSRHVLHGTEYIVHMTNIEDVVTHKVFALTDSRFTEVSEQKAAQITDALKKELDETLAKVGKKEA